MSKIPQAAFAHMKAALREYEKSTKPKKPEKPVKLRVSLISDKQMANAEAAIPKVIEQLKPFVKLAKAVNKELDYLSDIDAEVDYPSDVYAGINGASRKLVSARIKRLRPLTRALVKLLDTFDNGSAFCVD
jgi:hypothetical protein